MCHSHFKNEEIVRRGEELYEREIRARLDPQHRGRFLVLDVRSGEYEIADTAIEAIDRLRSRKPGAMLYILRVGFRTAYKF